jgi:hypothetical protein
MKVKEKKSRFINSVTAFDIFRFHCVVMAENKAENLNNLWAHHSFNPKLKPSSISKSFSISLWFQLILLFFVHLFCNYFFFLSVFWVSNESKKLEWEMQIKSSQFLMWFFFVWIESVSRKHKRAAKNGNLCFFFSFAEIIFCLLTVMRENCVLFLFYFLFCILISFSSSPHPQFSVRFGWWNKYIMQCFFSLFVYAHKHCRNWVFKFMKMCLIKNEIHEKIKKEHRAF